MPMGDALDMLTARSRLTKRAAEKARDALPAPDLGGGRTETVTGGVEVLKGLLRRGK